MYVKFGARQEATAEKKDGEEGAESGTAEGGGKTADDIKKEDAAAAADAEIVDDDTLKQANRKTGYSICVKAGLGESVCLFVTDCF